MKTEVLVTLLSFLTLGIKVNESAGNDNEVMCRAVRNLRKDLVSQLRARYPEVDPSNCAILDNCSNVECSLSIPEQRTELLNIELSLQFCDAQPFVQFSSNSTSFSNSSWIRKFSISNDLQPQKVQIPWNTSKGNQSSVGESPTWFLTVNLYPSHSQTVQVDERHGLFVTFEAILEMCQGVKSGVDNCNVLILLKVSPISFSQICDDVQADMALTAKSMKSVEPETLNLKTAGLNLYKHSHEGKKCEPNDPFSCGIGGNCRTTKSDKEGLCECFYTYEYDVNGSCVPIHQPVTPPDADSESSSSPILGAFLAIGALILIGACIFYGIRYNVFTRLRTRLPLYFNFCPFRRSPTVLEVHDQVSMVNPLYGSDSDDPPLL